MTLTATRIGIHRRERFAAPWPAELVSSIPAVQYNLSGGQQRHFRRIAHVMVPACRPGDMLECAGEFQVSNALPFIVELAACLVFTRCADGTCGIEHLRSLSAPYAEPSGGRFVSRFVGKNITPNQCEKFPYGGEHHALWGRSTAFEVPAGWYGDSYVAIVAYCGGQLYMPTSDAISVDAMCVDLSVLRQR